MAAAHAASHASWGDDPAEGAARVPRNEGDSAEMGPKVAKSQFFSIAL